MTQLLSRSFVVLVCATASSLAVTAGVVGAARAMTASPPVREAASARVQKAADGHYWARAAVDGRALDVLVDTGASTVALTPADARALGVQPDALAYTRPVATAAGRVRAAPVRLAHVAVGGVELAGVDALVVPQGLERSLLGMSFLGRLKGFSADPAGLTLRN